MTAHSAPPTPTPPSVINPAAAADPPADPAALKCTSVCEMQTARRSGVTSLWLASGVRVHHRRIDREPGRVVVTIALCGGKLLEDQASRGISEIAAGVLDDWDTAAPAAARANHMEGRDVRIDAAAGQDATTLRISGARWEIEPALAVVRDLLGAPLITAQNVDAAREQLLRELSRRAADPRALISDALNRALLPMQDARMRPPDERAIKAITSEQVVQWIDRQAGAAGAPIEAAFVGDISLAEAVRLADAALGSLPLRPRPSADTNLDRRTVPAPAGPIRQDIRLDADTPAAPRATVIRGCFGPEMNALADQRAVRAVLRIATTRLAARLTPPRFSVPGGPSAGLYLSAFKGLGVAIVVAPVTNEEQAESVGEAIDEEIARLAREGPTAEELQTAAAELAKAADKADKDPRYWSEALARCESTGLCPEEMAAGGAFYRTLSVEQARATFARYARAERAISLTIRAPKIDHDR